MIPNIGEAEYVLHVHLSIGRLVPNMLMNQELFVYVCIQKMVDTEYVEESEIVCMHTKYG